MLPYLSIAVFFSDTLAVGDDQTPGPHYSNFKLDLCTCMCIRLCSCLNLIVMACLKRRGRKEKWKGGREGERTGGREGEREKREVEVREGG